jgi:hypothetical protein
MKPSRIPRYVTKLLPLLVAGCLLLTMSCATTGKDRAAKTVNSIQDVDTEIRTFVLRTDETAAALQALTEPGQVSLSRAFGVFKDSLVRLEDQGTLVLRRESELSLAQDAYLTKWPVEGGSYVNAEVQKLSEKRKLELAAAFAEVPQANAGLEETYLTYLADLKEIRQYLDNDLTTSGILAIGSTSRLAVERLGALKTKLKPVIYALDAIKAEMNDGSR